MQIAPACQRLVAFLALQHGPTSRATASGTLWPDAPSRHAAHRLRSALWRLPLTPSGPLVEHGSNALSLTSGLLIDTRLLEQQAAALSATTASEPVDIPSAELLRSELLPEWDEEWLLSAREWLRQVRLRSLERLCALHCKNGRLDLALEAGMAAIECEPLRESAHRVVVMVHLADGNSAEALRQYDLYRTLMAPLLSRPMDA
ncbi:BTAD domain-containing putative transcriptional regulator [Streptomyces sp. NPDC127574]|uniref:AfsR/SARP family transcriptional regulator n=1 Tax=Streptomyces sp. NPDC127574 TaxID=3345401 RepID=UPI00362DC1F9